MAEHDGLSQYRKAAARRLRDAEELLQPPSLASEEQGADTRHLRGAVYLAGYAVECVLKAYIISQAASAMSLAEAGEERRRAGEERRRAGEERRRAGEERRRAGEQVPNILGADGHDLRLLLSLTDLEERFTDNARKRDWSLCMKWKPAWRYDPKPPTATFALEFMGAVKRIYQWVERQI